MHSFSPDWTRDVRRFPSKIDDLMTSPKVKQMYQSLNLIVFIWIIFQKAKQKCFVFEIFHRFILCKLNNREKLNIYIYIFFLIRFWQNRSQLDSLIWRSLDISRQMHFYFYFFLLNKLPQTHIWHTGTHTRT